MSVGDILIVEDERIIAQDLKKELEFFGYNVCGIASCGRDAIQIAEEAKPDLVLMDINIKGNVDGIQVAKEMKSRFNLPVIYLTGYADEHTIERVKETSPAGYLVKPFNQKEVRAAIELALGSRLGVGSKVREAWFSSLLQSMAEAVFVVDRRGMISYANPAAERLSAVEVGGVMGKQLDAMLISRHPPPTPNFTASSDEGEAGVVHPGVFRPTRGATVDVEYTMSPLKDGEGDDLGTIIVLRESSRRVV